MHKGVMPSNNPLPCPSVHVLSHSFKLQQRMQVDSGIPSDSMDAIIFAKLGLSLGSYNGRAGVLLPCDWGSLSDQSSAESVERASPYTRLHSGRKH